MDKQLRLNAFITNSAVHLSPGLWRHPRDRALGHGRLPFWQDLARLLERGLFDALFIADAIGVSNVYGDSQDMSIRYGLRVPRHDPFLVIPAMAAVTEHLGYGVTGTLSYEPPFLFARRMSSLDHLTEGRAGWNIVTGHLAAGARAMGRDAMTGHDRRYDIADEYMDVVYALWEGSWEDDAVRRDRATGIYADPAKVHRVRHEGETYRVDSIHMVEPSPQRTPVLFQAGASARGRQFAATHAECVFLSAMTKDGMAPVVADIRARAAERGRDPREILCLALMTAIVAPTDELARAKLTEYRSFINLEASLASLSGFTGIDLSKHAPDDPFPNVKQDSGVHSIVDSLSRANDGRRLTVRDVAELGAIGGSGPLIVGSPAKVADELQAWARTADVDGFNLSYATCPGDFEDFIAMVVPELQARGVYKRAYAPGTFREKLYGGGRSRIAASHPAARFRRDGAGSGDPGR
ncbi:MAG: LLM class flavin-dependent oxidoreductase [Alphaproteobacteria bacterium]|nr:LLM class flavin-dependent oxidoreductase [Alphaproteobacteria bacterium]